MVARIIANFLDSIDEFGCRVDGINWIDCSSIEDVYNAVKEFAKSDSLTHVHLIFGEIDCTFKTIGECTIAFKEPCYPITYL